MTTNTEVYDEAELAEFTERAERESGVNEIRSKVFQGTKEEAAKLADPNKLCQDCELPIPIERQLVYPTAKFCIDCQEWHDAAEERKRRMTGTGFNVLGVFG
jgi:RNA polymerase-binding transcription factor DksA